MEIWLGWSDVSCHNTCVYHKRQHTSNDDEEDNGGKDDVILAILSMRCKIKHFDCICVLFLPRFVFEKHTKQQHNRNFIFRKSSKNYENIYLEYISIYRSILANTVWRGNIESHNITKRAEFRTTKLISKRISHLLIKAFILSQKQKPNKNN